MSAGRLGLPLALAIIGGQPAQLAPLVDLYRRVARDAGHDPSSLRWSINSHGHVADDSRRARDESFPAFKLVLDQLGRERGWPPLSRAAFDASTDLRGANVVGSPQEVIETILYQHEIFGHHRMLLQLSVGTMPHRQVMRAIELLGTVVAAAVRQGIQSKA